jgi:membrane fusion protein, multidrug efflux system
MTGNDYLITSGLKVGDRVIIAGVQKIGDGAPVIEAPSGGAKPGSPGPAAPKQGEKEPAGSAAPKQGEKEPAKAGGS